MIYSLYVVKCFEEHFYNSERKNNYFKQKRFAKAKYFKFFKIIKKIEV